MKQIFGGTLCFQEGRTGEIYAWQKVKGGCTEVFKSFNVKEAFGFYKDVAKNSGIPKGNQEGNGHKMVKYPANGEASDWMLGNRGIYAMSPELGTADKNSEEFFIQDRGKLKQVVSDNYPWIKYTMLKLLPSVSVKVTNLFEPKRANFNSTSLVLKLQFEKNSLKFNALADNTPISCHQVLLFEIWPDLEIQDLQLPEAENHFKVDDIKVHNHTTFFELRSQQNFHTSTNEQISVVPHNYEEEHHIQEVFRKINKEYDMNIVQPFKIYERSKGEGRYKHGLTFCFNSDTKPTIDIKLGVTLERKRDDASASFPVLQTYDHYFGIVYNKYDFNGVSSVQELTKEDVP